MLKKMLEFEENTKLLEYRFATRYELIWPFIRYDVLNRVVSKSLVQSPINHMSKSIVTPLIQIYDLIKPMFRFNQTFSGSDIVFLYDSVSNINTDGIYFNRLFDYYAGIFESNTVMVESAFTKGHQKPRWFKKVHNFQGKINFRRIKTKFGSLDQRDAVNIDAFLDYLKYNCPVAFDEDDYIFFRETLKTISISLKYIKEDYQVLFEKYKPKIIFIEDALYGSYNAYVIKIAKEMGIITAEFQHGMINRQHIAYSYSSMLSNNAEYKQYTPDYLLTMGQYWCDACQVPSEKVVIGMPHLYNKVNEYNNRVNKQKKPLGNIDTVILFIGGTQEKQYLHFLRYLSKAEPSGFTFILKVHPLYSADLTVYKEFEKVENVKIVCEGDILEYISEADWIVGDASTSLYEAVAFNKKIVVLENQDSLLYTPIELGVWVKTPKELLDIIHGIRFVDCTCKTEFWEENWKKNYIDFIDRIGLKINNI